MGKVYKPVKDGTTASSSIIILQEGQSINWLYKFIPDNGTTANPLGGKWVLVSIKKGWING